MAHKFYKHDSLFEKKFHRRWYCNIEQLRQFKHSNQKALRDLQFVDY